MLACARARALSLSRLLAPYPILSLCRSFPLSLALFLSHSLISLGLSLSYFLPLSLCNPNKNSVSETGEQTDIDVSVFDFSYLFVLSQVGRNHSRAVTSANSDRPSRFSVCDYYSIFSYYCFWWLILTRVQLNLNLYRCGVYSKRKSMILCGN